jgi:glutamine cyclotransferase
MLIWSFGGLGSAKNIQPEQNVYSRFFPERLETEPVYTYKTADGKIIETTDLQLINELLIQQNGVKFEITPMKQFGIQLRDNVENYPLFENMLKNLEEQGYTITKDNNQLIKPDGTILLAKTDPATGEIIYGENTRLIHFFHEIKHLGQIPTIEGSLLWYKNELVALKYELELVQKTGAYNGLEMEALQNQIDITQIKYDMACYAGD